MNVDFLPIGVTRLAAPIGMTSIPGRTRPLVDDLADLRRVHAVELLVSLVADHELEKAGIADLVEQGRAHRIEVRRFVIPDFSTPRSREAFVTLVGEIVGAARAGRTTVLHCWAGLGRTGLVAACCLVACGFSHEEAIETVRRHRPGTIENLAQLDYIARFAAP